MQFTSTPMKDTCFAVSNEDCMKRACCPDCKIDALVRQARCTRRSARGFSNTVQHYAADMPRLLDAFHHSMEDFRNTARQMRTFAQI